MRCANCGRQVNQQPVRIGQMTLGPTCARNLGYGRKHHPSGQRVRPDARQGELQFGVPG